MGDRYMVYGVDVKPNKSQYNDNENGCIEK